MSALFPPRGAPAPPSPDGLRIGAVLAVLVHVLLLIALAFGVNWRAHTPEGAAAELWSAVPQVAAPRAAAPPPPPPVPTKRLPPVAAKPEPVAPTPPPPTPAPAPEPPKMADADIAIEKARRAAAEAAEREKALQREAETQEALRKEEAARREAEREKAEREQTEREKAEREKLAREKAEREKVAREKAEREKVERDKLAREKAEREKAEREKAMAEAARQEKLAKEAEARRAKEAAERAQREEVALAAQREAYLKRIQGQAGATGAPDSTGTAAQSSGPSANYAGRIRARIKPNIVLTDNVPGNPVATVEVRCAADGTIVSRKLVKSSGSALWDETVLRAIDRTETLPRDVDGRVPSLMQIEFRPRD